MDVSELMAWEAVSMEPLSFPFEKSCFAEDEEVVDMKRDICDLVGRRRGVAAASL